jgi:hypothetical protein
MQFAFKLPNKQSKEAEKKVMHAITVVLIRKNTKKSPHSFKWTQFAKERQVSAMYLS